MLVALRKHTQSGVLATGDPAAAPGTAGGWGKCLVLLSFCSGCGARPAMPTVGLEAGLLSCLLIVSAGGRPGSRGGSLFMPSFSNCTASRPLLAHPFCHSFCRRTRRMPLQPRWTPSFRSCSPRCRRSATAWPPCRSGGPGLFVLLVVWHRRAALQVCACWVWVGERQVQAVTAVLQV